MSDAREEWRWIPGYEGSYLVSNKGRVKSMKTGRGAQPGKVLIISSYPNGYQKVMLMKNHKAKNVLIHRAVALAFIPKPDGKDFVNHIDGNPQNNVVENLEWVTRSENCLHAVRVLGKKHGGGERSVKLNKQQVAEIFKSNLSNVALSRMYGVSDVMVSRIKRRKSWRSITCQ